MRLIGWAFGRSATTVLASFVAQQIELVGCANSVCTGHAPLPEPETLRALVDKKLCAAFSRTHNSLADVFAWSSPSAHPRFPRRDCSDHHYLESFVQLASTLAAESRRNLRHRPTPCTNLRHDHVMLVTLTNEDGEVRMTSTSQYARMPTSP